MTKEESALAALVFSCCNKYLIEMVLKQYPGLTEKNLGKLFSDIDAQAIWRKLCRAAADEGHTPLEQWDSLNETLFGKPIILFNEEVTVSDDLLCFGSNALSKGAFLSSFPAFRYHIENKSNFALTTSIKIWYDSCEDRVHAFNRFMPAKDFIEALDQLEKLDEPRTSMERP